MSNSSKTTSWLRTPMATTRKTRNWRTARRSSGETWRSISSFTWASSWASGRWLPSSRSSTPISGVSFSAELHFQCHDYRFFFVPTVTVIMACCNLSVCIGVHRLWSHRSFKVTRNLKLFLLFFYTMSGQVRFRPWTSARPWERLQKKLLALLNKEAELCKEWSELQRKVPKGFLMTLKCFIGTILNESEKAFLRNF